MLRNNNIKKKSTMQWGLFLLFLIVYLPQQLNAQQLTVSSSLGAIKLFEKNEIGIVSGLSLSFPVVNALDIGFSYHYAMSSKSPSNEQAITQEEINSVYHYSHNEFGIYGSLDLINIKRYQFNLRSGILLNKYVDSFLVPSHFIDSDTNLRAYLSDYRSAWLYGANFSIENSILLSNAFTASIITGFNIYNSKLNNSFSASFVLVYRIDVSKD